MSRPTGDVRRGTLPRGRIGRPAAQQHVPSMLALLALERFPPPDFGGGHSLPVNQHPGPRGLPLEYLDVAVLVLALALATWLVLRKRSRRGVVWLGIFSVLYFGFYRNGCVCSIGSIQNVALAMADPSYAIPATALAFFLVPLVAALLFGRTFCAAVCPHGALQDLLAIKPVPVPEWLDRALRLGAATYLGLGVMFAALGSAFLICEYDPFIPVFRMSGSAGMVGLGVGFVALSMFVGRPYCRWLCPYGVLLGLASSVSKWRVRITPTTCDSCRLCERSCPVGAIHPSSLPEQRPDRRRVAVAFVLIPVVLITTPWAGRSLGTTFSQKNSTVQLAVRVAAEEAGTVEGATDYSTKFRESGQSVAALAAEARVVIERFRQAGLWLGLWVGVVIAVKLFNASVRRRRPDYEADPMHCIGCARCYDFCPQEHHATAR